MTTQKQRREQLSAWLRRIWLRQTDFVLAMLVTLAGLALFAFSGIGGNTHAGFVFLQNIEQRSLDLRFGMRGERPHDDRIVIVGIDEKTLQKIGSFPLPRDSYALLIKQLDAGGAGVIAFDETFPTPASNSAIAALEELRRDAGKSVSPALLEKIKDIENSSDQDASFGRGAEERRQRGARACFSRPRKPRIHRCEVGRGLLQHRVGEVVSAGRAY